MNLKILVKEISMMPPGRIGTIKSERLLRIIRSNEWTYRIALHLLRIPAVYKIYRSLKARSEFNSRLNRIVPSEYLDTSHKPDLNVILVVVDSLRNSRLSSQGYFRETTPFLDSLESRFTAISASSWTYPSVASILTGLYPHNHNAVLAGRIKDIKQPQRLQALTGDILTLPEMLFLLGYEIYFGTAISLALYPLRGRVIAKAYDGSARADELLDDLTKWISKKKKGKFFAYVHLADLHIPLNPPDSFRNFFGDVKNLPRISGWDFMKPEQQKADKERFQEYKENRELLYDNLLRYVDHAIECFYKSLEAVGLVDSTIFIVTADHGEEFWEHAELEARSFYHQRGFYGVTHGQAGFGEVIEVPLVMSGPLPERKGTGFVSAVDIVPTVLDLLGIRHNMRFDGANIFGTEGQRPLLSEASGSGYEKKALVVGRYKLIYSEDDGVEWLFDLEKDPLEQHPIVDKEVTSVFVDKLVRMLEADKKRRIREIARRKGSSKASNV